MWCWAEQWAARQNKQERAKLLYFMCGNDLGEKGDQQGSRDKQCDETPVPSSLQASPLKFEQLCMLTAAAFTNLADEQPQTAQLLYYMHRLDQYLRAIQDMTEPGRFWDCPENCMCPGNSVVMGSTAMLRTAVRGQSLQVWKRREEQEVHQ